jgi:hypothetical protein
MDKGGDATSEAAHRKEFQAGSAEKQYRNSLKLVLLIIRQAVLAPLFPYKQRRGVGASSCLRAELALSMPLIAFAV